MQTGIPDFGSVFQVNAFSGSSRPAIFSYEGYLLGRRLADRLLDLPEMETAAQENAVVFVVENSAEYMYQLEQAFRRAGSPIDLKIARYGNEAVLYLKGVGIYADRATYPLPKVIILDLDLPDGSPLAVLGWIRQQTDLTGTSVLTTGYPDQQKLIHDARELGALAWFPKTDFAGIINTVESLVRSEERRAIAA